MFKNLLLKAGKGCLLVLCIFTSLVAAAEMKITGKVIGNDDRQPVAGATVTVISAGKKRRRSFNVRSGKFRYRDAARIAVVMMKSNKVRPQASLAKEYVVLISASHYFYVSGYLLYFSFRDFCQKLQLSLHRFGLQGK